MTLRPNWKWCLLAAAFAQLCCLPPTRTESGDGPKVITPTLSPTNVQPENLIVRKTVYVPIYSQIYVGSARISFQLTATLSVRNTDRGKPIVIQSITYFDSTGSVVREYLEAPSLLGPLATADFIVERADTTGGSGASFLVEWGAEHPVTEPHLEAVIIGQAGTAGISFVTQGVVVESSSRPEEDPQP